MSRSSNEPIVAALGGFLLTAPFLLLEWINTPNFWSVEISPLFFMMWLVGSIFTFVGVSILKGGKKAKTSLILLIIKVAILILMAWIFAGLVIDQWPCFMGIPNCD